MSLSKAFLSTDVQTINYVCMICNRVIKKTEKSQEIGEKGGITNFKALAEEWSQINVPLHDERHPYTEVYAKIVSRESQNASICVHTNCRIAFRNNSTRYRNKYGCSVIDTAEEEGDSSSEKGQKAARNSPKKRATRSETESATSKYICFICNTVRSSDKRPYDEGGLKRCDTDSTARKLFARKELFLKEKTHRFSVSARRLNLLLSGQAHDIFAVDIFYHQSCYIKFAIKPVSQREREEEEKKGKEEDVINAFLYRVKTSIVRDKKAFLLNELLTDIQFLSEEQQLERSAIAETKTLRRLLQKELGDQIGFFPSGIYRIVHSSDINPCEYSVATLHGCGLRSEDHVRAFGRMIREKIKLKQKQKYDFPLTPEEFIKTLDDGPLPELYNAIFYSMHDRASINEYGYAVTSRVEATKIWSLASDWESILTKAPSPKQAIMGLVLHRLTGNKEVINTLHKCNHVMSYNNIRMQNQAWSRMVFAQKSFIPSFRRGVVTHSTIDNNDGRQDTWTGSGTTHDTNKTVFQLPSKEERLHLPVIGTLQRPLDIEEERNEEIAEIAPYYIGRRVDPPAFPNYIDSSSRDLLDECLKRDIAWSLAGSIKSEDLPLLGSWTPFNKMVTTHETEMCVQEYLPVTPHPPEFPVCKDYLDFLLDMIEELEIPYMFVHSDEMVYSKLCAIMWKNPELYRHVVLLMGGFHQVRVMQRLLFKRYSCRGIKEWCIDAEVIASGSADSTFEGRHYFRSMRLHKECFDALVQFRIEQITDGHSKTDHDLMSAITALRKEPSPSTMSALIDLPQFTVLCERVLYHEEGSDGQFTVQYMKDVSVMLALISSVRECNIERHLEAEREMISLAFAFDHQNYARYCSFQHVSLQELKRIEHPAFHDLQAKGHGGSITGGAFSTIHGDLITELFNKETKGTAGPFRSGFSTSLGTVNTWVHTIHIHSMLRIALRKQLHIKFSSKHKEMTSGGRRLHDKHVSQLKKVLQGYGTDPFSADTPKCFHTGAQISTSVIQDMLKAREVGSVAFQAFVSDRLVTNKQSFYDPIKRIKLSTGILKKKAPIKAVSVLKEDCQAFGLILAKAVSLEDAFRFPITSVPLALATPDGSLRQSDKASLRNLLISKSKFSVGTPPKNAAWFVDGLAAVRTLRSKKTYREWIIGLLRFLQPPEGSTPSVLGMINDTYRERSVKSSTRKARGETGLNVRLEGFDQHMPQGANWNEFLQNGKNKEELIKLIFNYIQSEEGRKSLQQPFIMTEGPFTYVIDKNRSEVLHECNHEEADTRLILHASLADTDTVIVSKDTDVLILLVWAFNKLGITKKWLLKYDSDKFVDIGGICDAIGPNMSNALPAIHALSGCDTTSYFFKVGKVKILKKLLNAPEKLRLLDGLGETSTIKESELEKVKEFIRTVFYNGKITESYVTTRMRIYKELKVKSSSTIPPDPDSAEEAIKRVNYQLFHWLRCTQVMMPDASMEKNGWRWDEEAQLVAPVWFKGKQLPPSLTIDRKPQKLGAKRRDPQEADSEMSDDGSTRQKKRSRRKRKLEASRIVLPKQVDADEEMYDGGEEGDKESTGSRTEEPIVTDFNDEESMWEISDFSSSDDSFDEWLP